MLLPPLPTADSATVTRNPLPRTHPYFPFCLCFLSLVEEQGRELQLEIGGQTHTVKGPGSALES